MKIQKNCVSTTHLEKNLTQETEITCLDLCFSVKGYEKTIEKGSDAEMANLKTFREESVIEF